MFPKNVSQKSFQKSFQKFSQKFHTEVSRAPQHRFPQISDQSRFCHISVEKDGNPTQHHLIWKLPGCEHQGEWQEKDGVAEGDGDGEGDHGGAAKLAGHALPQQRQHQHRHPVGQERPGCEWVRDKYF